MANSLMASRIFAFKERKISIKHKFLQLLSLLLAVTAVWHQQYLRPAAAEAAATIQDRAQKYLDKKDKKQNSHLALSGQV